MIHVMNDDLFDSPAECLVNTVNCEGFMGKGIAYQFKQRYPENNKVYEQKCKSNAFHIGDILFFLENNKLIANFPTKDKWREKSTYEYIEKGLQKLKDEISFRNITSIGIPPLGCGNGGLDWNKVKALIEDYLSSLPIEIYLYAPSTKYTAPKESSIPKMTASHLLLMKLKAQLNHFNKLTLQKSAFFMNIFSGDEYFKFEQYKFGPYAHSIEILSQQIKSFQESYHLKSTTEAEVLLYNNLISKKVEETVEKYTIYVLQASSFVNSFQSCHELEVAATIVALVKLYPNSSDEELIEQFFKWPKWDKTRFSREEIQIVTKNLIESNIIRKDLVGYSLPSFSDNTSTMYKYRTS